MRATGGWRLPIWRNVISSGQPRCHRFLTSTSLSSAIERQTDHFIPAFAMPVANEALQEHEETMAMGMRLGPVLKQVSQFYHAAEYSNAQIRGGG
jgi:hypothetical protein